MFSYSTVEPDSKENELRSSYQEAYPSAGKKHWGSFSAMSGMEVCPYSYFRRYEHFQNPWVLFVIY